MQVKLREDPISLHKYLYANANPVSNSDPTGNSALVGGITAGGIISDVEARHNTAVMKIFAKLMVKLNAIALFITTYKIQIMLITLLVMFATGVATGGLGIPEDVQSAVEEGLNEIQKSAQKTSKIIAAILASTIGNYWRPLRVGSHIEIPSIPISFNEALSDVRISRNIFARNIFFAYTLAFAAKPSVIPTLHLSHCWTGNGYERFGSSSGFWPHFHIGKHSQNHIWFFGV